LIAVIELHEWPWWLTTKQKTSAPTKTFRSAPHQAKDKSTNEQNHKADMCMPSVR
jgi:hypothetical protein